MKQETIVFLMMIAVLIIATSIIPTIGSSFIDESEDEINFEDVTVLVFGRCRIIIEPWNGRVFIGEIDHIGVATMETYFENINILIWNKSTGKLFSDWRLTSNVIYMYNITGFFYRGAISAISRFIPPKVFIFCHADRLTIHY